jgi:hypothetical protein
MLMLYAYASSFLQTVLAKNRKTVQYTVSLYDIRTEQVDTRRPISSFLYFDIGLF